MNEMLEDSEEKEGEGASLGHPRPGGAALVRCQGAFSDRLPLGIIDGASLGHRRGASLGRLPSGMIDGASLGHRQGASLDRLPLHRLQAVRQAFCGNVISVRPYACARGFPSTCPHESRKSHREGRPADKFPFTATG